MKSAIPSIRTGINALIAVPLLAAFLLSCSEDDPTDPGTGDDVTLDPPPAGQGFQIVLGPFDVPVGEEMQRNFYMKLPVDQDVYITKIEFRFNPGSHHMNIFKSDTVDVVDHVEDTYTAFQWESWDMVAASQSGNLTWMLPAGVAIKLKAHAQMDFQTHYVNAGTQQTPSNRGKVIINFWTTDQSNVTSQVGAIFSNNKKVLIPPHTAATFCKVVQPLDYDINLLLMTGHFHSRGRTFTVGHWDGATQKLKDTIYHSDNWDDPPILQFPTTLTIPAGDSIAYFTTYENRTDTELKFGPHVEIEEHANLFTFYYPGPSDGKAVYDFNGGFLVESHPIQ